MEIIKLNNVSSDFLKRISGLANQDNTLSMREQRKILKINYEEGLKIPKGAWVLGQKREGSKIIDPGVEVKYIIIQKVYYKHFYMKNDIICQSKYILNATADTVGSYYKSDCRHCKYRKEKNGCKLQIVVFCLSIVNKTLIESIMFIKGDSFMPFINYIKESCKEKTTDDKGKEVEVKIPYFSFITELGTKEKKNLSVNYYVINFNKHSYLNFEMVSEIAKKVEQIPLEVEDINKSIISNSITTSVVNEKNDDIDVIDDFNSNETNDSEDIFEIENIPF